MAFRKRSSEEDMAAILEASIPRLEKSGNDEDNNDPPNGGTLVLDATCCPADITYHQNVNLLNQAREKLEQTVDEICKSTGEKSQGHTASVPGGMWDRSSGSYKTA